jgi:hypothetical protein
MDDELIEQEFFCSFAGAHSGSVYGKAMAKAEKEGRICRVPYDPGFLVNTWWDIGVDDATAIWFTQDVGREVRVIDYLEWRGEGLEWYARHLRGKSREGEPQADHRDEWSYGTHTFPHDIRVREWGNSKSRIKSAEDLGIKVSIMPDLALADGIDAARRFIARCVFDAVRCKKGLNALVSYHREWDDKLQRYSSQPVHDWSSHGADAWRTLGVSHKTTLIAMSDEEQRLRDRQIQVGTSGVDVDNAGWMRA